MYQKISPTFSFVQEIKFCEFNITKINITSPNTLKTKMNISDTIHIAVRLRSFINVTNIEKVNEINPTVEAIINILQTV